MAIKVRTFLKELRRRKVYHVSVVYVVVGWGVSQGAEFLLGDVLPLPKVFWQTVMGLVILGFPIALVLAWAYEVRPEQEASEDDPTEADRSPAGDLAGSGTTDPSSAVLPFESLSSDPQGDYFADSITVLITNALAKQKGLRVAARNCSFAFKDERIDIREIG